MRYIQQNSSTSYPYPDHDINPKDKGADWCRQYAQAAWSDWTFGVVKGVFAANGGDYQTNRLYALGKQPVTLYKKLLGVNDNNQTWMSVDWSIRPIIPYYRDKVISKLLKEYLNFNVIATAIDSQAKGALNDFYAAMKAKLLVRQQMLQTNPQLATHPDITIQTGEPLDLEELEMRMNLGEQFNRSMDAELAIQLGFYENNFESVLREWLEDLFDFGVTGYNEWLGDDNRAKFARTDPEQVLISVSKKSGFNDIIHAGEIVDVPLIELATLTNDDGTPVFTQEELIEFAGSIAGKMGNPKMSVVGSYKWPKPIDKFKCKVLKIKFFTYNDSAYRNTTDDEGNVDFRKADYGRGKVSDKYTRKRVQYVYQCSWIVGTEKVYDYGMSYDQKRSTNAAKRARTELPYRFRAYNFYEMKAASMMDRLKSLADDYQLTWLKIQNFKNRAVPSGWWIDLDALENVAMNKGGKNMEPFELLRMFFDTGVLVGRSTKADMSPQSPNWKPVIPIQNTAATELAMLYQDLVNIIGSMDRITGFNDITSGNPDPKTLVPGYELANQSTNDALYPIAFAAEKLIEKLAYDVLCRMQQAVRKGEVTGFAPYKGALSASTLRFISLDESIASIDFGIELQAKTTQEEKMWILQQLNQDIAAGFLDTSDAIMILETHNAKQAMQILQFKVKKAKEAQQQNQMAIQQQQGQNNLQLQMVANQQKQQELEAELQSKAQIAYAQIQSQERIKMMQIQSEEKIAMAKFLASQEVANTTGQAKIAAQAMASHSEVAKAHLTGLHAMEREQVAAENSKNSENE